MASTKPQFRLTGIENVMRNMNEELRKIKGRSRKGLIHANIVIHRAMETESPTIPVDTANLRHSYFATISGGVGVAAGKSPTFKGEQASKMKSEHSTFVASMSSKVNTTRDPAMILGFSANYALFVHENMEASFKRPGSGAKYMEVHLNRKQGEMLEEIRKEAYIQ